MISYMKPSKGLLMSDDWISLQIWSKLSLLKQTLSLHGTYKDDGLNKRQRYKAINFRNLDIDNTSTSRQMSGWQKQGPSKSH